MIIGIDLDNVCVTTTEAVIEYINERVPVNLSIENITSYWIENFLPTQYKWIAKHAFEDKEMWKKVKIIKGCKKYVKKLYEEGHEIYFVTSSLPENLKKKIKHLSRNLDFLPENYIFSHTINIHKKQLLKLDYLIDDCLDNLTGERDYISICMDYPWNRHPHNEKYFKRVKDWEEIYDFINLKEK